MLLRLWTLTIHYLIVLLVKLPTVSLWKWWVNSSCWYETWIQETLQGGKRLQIHASHQVNEESLGFLNGLSLFDGSVVMMDGTRTNFVPEGICYLDKESVFSGEVSDSSHGRVPATLSGCKSYLPQRNCVEKVGKLKSAQGSGSWPKAFKNYTCSVPIIVAGVHH